MRWLVEAMKRLIGLDLRDRIIALETQVNKGDAGLEDALLIMGRAFDDN